MSPAFSSTRQAAAFAGLLLALLLLPAVPGKTLLPPREQIYSATPWEIGAFPYMHDEFFAEKGDIDIAFVGSSIMWWDIDTPRVQAQLSEQLGRPAVVRSYCWNWAGADPLYFMMRDLLEHRKVHLIVFHDCTGITINNAHNAAPYWFRLGDGSEAIAGLPLNTKVTFYASAILGMPRHLLELARTNGPVIPRDELTWTWHPVEFTNLSLANPASRLGSAGLSRESARTFAAYAPASSARPEDVRVYSEATRQDFHFSTKPISEMQAHFLRKIAALAEAHQARLVMLHLPLPRELNDTMIEEPVFWPDFFHGNLTLMGVAPAKFFEGTTQTNLNSLYWDVGHLNPNGQEYFTKLITPGLLRIYENQTKP